MGFTFFPITTIVTLIYLQNDIVKILIMSTFEKAASLSPCTNVLLGLK